MTREEQIKLIAFETSSNDYPISEYEGFVRGAKWADAHPNDEVLKLRKMFESDPDAYKQGYKDASEKAYEFIKECFSFEDSWHVEGETTIMDKVIEDFKKAMEEQQ